MIGNISRRRFTKKLGETILAVGIGTMTFHIKCSKGTPTSPEGDNKNESFELSINETPELAAIGGIKSLMLDGLPVTIFRLTEEGFVTFSRLCTHKSCTTEWNNEAKKFECPCHASTFYENGNVITGPATQRLLTFDTVYKASENKVVIRLTTT